MRIWYKTLLLSPGEDFPTHLDRTWTDHARGMGGYECRGYESRDQLFSTYFDERHRCYETFLGEHLPREGRTLSIASGRAINELRLGERGHDILCSDLRAVCPEATAALFPAYRFMAWNALDDPLPADRFDHVISLSFVYLLAPEALDRFFGRVAALLRPGGLFILDSAGSPDAWIANVLHDALLPIETRLAGAAWNLRARIRRLPLRRVLRKHHGYRYGDREFVSAGARHGLELEAVRHMDFENEWTRLVTYRWVLSRITPVRSAMLNVGRFMPYVRMFAFRRT